MPLSRILARSSPSTRLLATALGCLVAALALAHEEPVEPGPDAEALSHQHCENGLAGPYPCHDVDLLAVMPRAALGVDPSTVTANDLWAWVDRQTGIEYAIVGLSNGTAFVSLEDPEHPRLLGRLPTRTLEAPWRDVKVYQTATEDVAVIVADVAGHGLQIFDLHQLRGVTSPRTFEASAEYFGPGLGLAGGFALGSSHNVAVSERGFAYAVGSGTCNGGLHMVDIRDPSGPRFAGCFGDTGYTHDTQCTVYHGPDVAHQGRELCFNSDPEPSSLSIVDVEDKSAPRLIARLVYPEGAYAHQGWLTEDHRWFLLGDELDEGTFGVPTRTLVFDVSDLDAPRFVGASEGPSAAIGHNIYTAGGLAFEANYTSGLRILDLGGLATAQLDEVAYFDVTPETDAPTFRGAWSVYPWLPSGVVIVSSLDGGLFVLRPFPAEHPGGEGEIDAPPRPDRLQPILDGAGVFLSWRDPGADDAPADSFRVWRSKPGGGFALVGEVDQSRFQDDPGSGQHTWRVSAVRSGVESPRSVPSSLLVPTASDPDDGDAHPHQPFEQTILDPTGGLP